MLSEPKPYSEKRGFIRMKVDAPIAVRCGEAEFDAVCRNLSGSGLLVEAEREVPLGSLVEVCIEQEGENRVPFRASAEVTRCEADGESWILGLAIKDVHE